MPLTDPSIDLQRALVAKFKATEPLTALIDDRVFDSVLPGAVYPYVTLGEAQIFPELGEETDAADTSITIHAWSQKPGYGEVKQIGAAIIAALHDAELEIDTGVVQSLLLESARYLRDPDGKTSHGVFTFDILTDANS